MTETLQQAEPLPLVVLLNRVMEDVPGVSKLGEFRSQASGNYNFRGIDHVINAVGPALRKHGVVVMPTLLETTYRDVVVGKNRNPARECTVRVRYTFHGPMGDSLSVEVPGEALDQADKGTAKAMSVAYRIALLQALCIPTDESDPDAARLERAKESGARRQPTAQPDDAARDALFEASKVAPDIAAVKALWSDSAKGARAGKWTGKDAEEMQRLLTVRTAELKADGAAPPPETAQRASAQRQRATVQPAFDDEADAKWLAGEPVANGSQP